MTPPTADVGKWVRIGDRTEHQVVKRIREPNCGIVLITACGKRLLGEWTAIMIGPTRQACLACKAHAEIES